MIILGIETSCDETACAIVENGKTVLSSVIASSLSLHAKTGGIIPETAARKQVEYIIPVVDKALNDANKKILKQVQDVKNNSDRSTNSSLITNHQSLVTNIDAIAVTYGPGLIGSLLVGVETAKTLSYLWDKPLIGVNHLTAHLYANWISEETEKTPIPEFPLLGLVVSGGHTDLVYMKDHGDINWIGGTRDDAAGEAFDKTARLLGLPYPGGPEISRAADKFLLHHSKSVNQNLDLFPRPMIHTKDFDWSFSGLKTSVLNYTKTHEFDINHLSAEIQEAIVDVLIAKSLLAIEKYSPNAFVIGGGVSANKRLREKFLSAIATSKMKTTFHVPALKNSTDNAAVIASAAYYNQHYYSWKDLHADPELSITD